MNFPKREDYERLVQDISSKIERSGICFYLYGSFTRDSDFVPGRSDLDGGFILDANFVTSQADIVYLSHILRGCLNVAEEIAGLSSNDPGIKVNFNLMDRATNRDGRFLAYDDSYADYLKVNARIVSGPDFIQEMNGMNYKRESLRSAAYNLRKVRNGLLTYCFDLQEDPQKARRTILSSLNTLWSMPKKILDSLGKELKFEKDTFFETFETVFPEYNSALYVEARWLRKDPLKYHGILNDMDEAFNLSLEFLNATEGMVKSYIERFPSVSQLEVRTPTEK